MKKFLMIIFICIINISYIKAYDITDTFYYDTKVENMYITKVKGNTSKNGAPFLLHNSNVLNHFYIWIQIHIMDIKNLMGYLI